VRDLVLLKKVCSHRGDETSGNTRRLKAAEVSKPFGELNRSVKVSL